MPAKQQQGKLVTDSRFAAVHHDPRFQRFPKAKAKVEIDERFSGMFKDPSFQVKSVVDKRGRKTWGGKKNENMRRYYRLRDEHEEEAKQAQQAAQQAAPLSAGADDGGESERVAGKLLGRGNEEQERGQQATGAGAAAEPEPVARRRAARGFASTAAAAAAAAGKARQGSKQPAGSQGREEEEAEQSGRREAGGSGSSSSEGEEEEEELDEAAERWARMRGMAGPETSSEEEEEGARELASSSDDEQGDGRLGSSDEEESEEEDGEDVEALKREWGVGALAANPDEQARRGALGVPLSEATRRLAVVDLDWAHIRAVDILAVLRSFLPKGGRLERVTVYPSDYGLQRMAEEATAGPQGIWKAKQAAAEGSEALKVPAAAAAGEAAGSRGRRRQQPQGGLGLDSGGEDVEAPGSDAGPADPGSSAAASLDTSGDDSSADGDSDSADDDGADDNHPSSEDDSSADEDDDGEVDQQRLLLYERSKLRWYYAVAEFSTVEAASLIYDNCDGMEFLKSACKFDLRFVPDEQSFEGRQVRDSASEVPSDYTPPTFQTKALQHTSVSLTWDADDEGRKRALTKKMTADDLKEDDLKAYLASETEDSDEGDAVGDQPGAGTEEDEAAEGGVCMLRQQQPGHPANVGLLRAGKRGELSMHVRERYRRLLLGADVAEERKGKKDWGGDEEGAPGSQDGASSDESEDEARGPPAGPKARVKNDKGMEMEVTFLPGLENLGERLLAKKRDQEARRGETVWEAYMRRKREKRREAKRMGRKLVDSDEDDDSEDDYGGAGGSGDDQGVPADVKDDPFFQHEDNPFDDPFFQDDGKAPAAAASDEEGAKGRGSMKGTVTVGIEGKKKGSKADKEQQRQQQAEDARRKAELEMLVMDEGALAGAAAKAAAATKAGEVAGSKLSKKERMRLKKEARRRERTEGSDEEDMNEAQGSFQVDLGDTRFQEMFTSHHFALDPTDPRYARSDATQASQGVLAIAREAAKRRDGPDREGDRQNGAAAGSQHARQQPNQPSAAGAVNGQGGAGGGSADLRFMVASLKRKSAQSQQQVPSTASGSAAAGKNGRRSAAGAQRKSNKKQKL
ncbi:hypothetical protein N2152v2_004057 [Parachlorella kessleri]